MLVIPILGFIDKVAKMYPYIYIFGNNQAATDGTKLPDLNIADSSRGLAAWFRAKSTTLIELIDFQPQVIEGDSSSDSAEIGCLLDGFFLIQLLECWV